MQRACHLESKRKAYRWGGRHACVNQLARLQLRQSRVGGVGFRARGSCGFLGGLDGGSGLLDSFLLRRFHGSFHGRSNLRCSLRLQGGHVSVDRRKALLQLLVLAKSDLQDFLLGQQLLLLVVDAHTIRLLLLNACNAFQLLLESSNTLAHSGFVPAAAGCICTSTSSIRTIPYMSVREPTAVVQRRGSCALTCAGWHDFSRTGAKESGWRGKKARKSDNEVGRTGGYEQQSRAH